MNHYHHPPLGTSSFSDLLADRILHRFKNKGWNALVQRVTTLAQKAETTRNELDTVYFLNQLSDAMLSGKMLPNSPLLVNCDEENPRLFACFAVDIEKPKEDFLKTFKFIHDGMGGVGYSVRGDELNFPELIRSIDENTVAHQSGRPRPASNAVTMPISGNLDAFLELAGTLQVTNMNVALNDSFMNSLKWNESAQKRLHSIAEHIHATGQPGIIFPDRIQRISHKQNSTFAANVCGEAPLAVDESALLASVNLAAFISTDTNGQRRFNVHDFSACVQLCVRFLDGMHDLQTHANLNLQQNTLATRKIGVGVMGFAHALMLLGIRYGSQSSLEFAEELSSTLYKAAEAESNRLAELLGPYPAWQPSYGKAMRNANLTAIAGTATIALIVGTSCGIEPIFSHVISQNIIGTEICILDPVLAFLLEEIGIDKHDAEKRLRTGESLEKVAGKTIANLVPTALDLSGDIHIKVQAALQSNLDCGISKTVNCDFLTTVDEIKNWLIQGHASGCMGLTIYRNHSLKNQPVKKDKINDHCHYF